MSKVCIVLFPKTFIASKALELVENMVKKYNWGVFHELFYTEPFLEDFCIEGYLLCSFSDNFEYDNCEMLLLPDNCYINGKNNVVPFQHRMLQMETILRAILTVVPRIDLFIGDSGTSLQNFIENSIEIHDFMKMTRCLNSIAPPDIHYIITRDST